MFVVGDIKYSLGLFCCICCRCRKLYASGYLVEIKELFFGLLFKDSVFFTSVEDNNDDSSRFNKFNVTVYFDEVSIIDRMILEGEGVTFKLRTMTVIKKILTVNADLPSSLLLRLPIRNNSMIVTPEADDSDSKINAHSMVGSICFILAKECKKLCEDNDRINDVKGHSKHKKKEGNI